METLIKNIKKDYDYVEHYEVLIKTKYGFETILSFHPMSGEKPLMFDSFDKAKKYADEILSLSDKEVKYLLKSVNNDNDYKFIFKPTTEKWVEHYEILEKKIIGYSTIESFHPMTGKKPLMLENWNKCNNWVKANKKESGLFRKMRF